jgi:hypothetical protein
MPSEIKTPLSGAELLQLKVESGGNKLVTTQSIADLGGGGVSFGTDQQIPYMNATGDDYDYAGTLLFDDASSLLTLGDGTGSPELRIDKDGASEAYINFYSDSGANSYIRTSTLENLELSSGSTQITFKIGGSDRFRVTDTELGSGFGTGGSIKRTGSSATIPYVYQQQDANTGVGSPGSDQLSLIAGGVNILEIGAGEAQLSDQVVFKAGTFTATQASALTPADADFIYVTDTDGTFTSIGFWGYENGSWVKL